MYLTAIKYISSATIATLTTSKLIENKMLDMDSNISPPADTVSIIIPALNEEDYIQRCLISLRNQSIVSEYPQYFEYILVDNESTDRTIALAEPYVDKVIIAPRGKLNARNIGTLNSKGNIIVSVDSDMEFPYHYLNTLLKPFNSPSIAGVSGSIIDSNYPGTPKSLYILGATISRTLITPYRMMGGNCAYWKHLFYLTGQFNEKINQKNVKQMVQEEEFGLGKRLSQYGNILYKHNAPVIHLGGERIACRLGVKSSSLCKKMKVGIERFG